MAKGLGLAPSATVYRSRRWAFYLSFALLLSGARWSTGVHAQRLEPLGPLDANGRVTYFIADGEARSSYRSSDPDLAAWALEAWRKASDGAVTFVRTEDEDRALIRVYWAAPVGGQYGEMVPLEVDGKRGAAVFIRPDTTALGNEIARRAAKDLLFRDAIVYLTCLHELGHALGLEHTDRFEDIMYFFGFGGDVVEYFDRYRRQIH
jgi:hypothetical protein